MAEGRMLSRTISRSKQLARVHPLAAMLFAYLVPHQDSFGRMSGDPEMVKVEAVPLFKYFTPEIIAACLLELSTCRDGKGEPLVWWYEVEGDQVLEFPGFLRHNWIAKKRIAKASRFQEHTAPGAKPCRPRIQQLAPWQGVAGFTLGVVQERDRSGTGVVSSKKEGKKELPSPSSSIRPEKDSGTAALAATPVGAAKADPTVGALARRVADHLRPERAAS